MRKRTAGGRQEGGGSLTPFGEVVRTIRRDKGILLLDMARVADVSPGFMSLVETGKKPIPENLVTKIIAGLDLAPAAQDEIREAAALSAKEYKIQLTAGAPQLDRQVARALQTGFAKMSSKTKEQILRLLEEGGD